MDISLSNGEVATVLQALKNYVQVANDDGYKDYAIDLIAVITSRWEKEHPDVELV